MSLQQVSDIEVAQRQEPEVLKPEVLRPNQLGGLDVCSVAETEINFNMLIYGESGVGKTVLAGSACVVPELTPVLFLDIEGGTLSLRKRYPEVDVVRVQTWGQLVKVYDALKNQGHGYRTVVVDSLTETQKVGMTAIMHKAVVKAKDEKGEEKDPDLPGIGEWGKNTNQMRKLVRAYRDLPVNTIFTALAMSEKDKRGNNITKPSLSSKLSSEIAGFMDIVLYMYVTEKDGEQLRCLLSTKTKEIVAKDRTDKLPDIIKNPSAQLLHSTMFD